MTSKTTKRKYVTQEVLGDYVLPKDDQQIVRVSSYISIIGLNVCLTVYLLILKSTKITLGRICIFFIKKLNSSK